MDLIQQILSVGFVFAALGVALWWLNRKGLAQFGSIRRPKRSPSRLEQVERLRLTPQHTLLLVRLADRGLLISLHPGGCNLLESGPWREYEAAARERGL